MLTDAHKEIINKQFLEIFGTAFMGKYKNL